MTFKETPLTHLDRALSHTLETRILLEGMSRFKSMTDSEVRHFCQTLDRHNDAIRETLNLAKELLYEKNERTRGEHSDDRNPSDIFGHELTQDRIQEDGPSK